MRRFAILCFVALSALPVGRGLAVTDDAGIVIPPPFAPFEHLAGGWKGMGIPAANRLKGWPERHLWAWRFQGGSPVGMVISLEGDKILAKGQLTYDAATKRYKLVGTTAEGKPVSFTGTMDGQGQTLTLERDGLASGGKERLTLRLSTNRIRYTIWLDREEPGAPQFSRVISINLGKEGEEFAAGSTAASVTKCIMTGGAATMTVSYEGKSYPVCCTGCRDEFMENPAKYVKLAALRAQTSGTDKAKPAAARAVGPDDGAFDGLVDEPKKPAKPAAKAAAKPPKPDAAETATADPEPASKKSASSPRADDAARAASLLRSAQSLDKLGKTEAALDYYRQIVAKYPGSTQAKTAAARIKAIEP